MLKRSPGTIILAAILLCGSATLPVFAHVSSRNVITGPQDTMMKDDKMKDPKAAGARMTAMHRHRRHRRHKHGANMNKMHSKNNM